MAIFLRKFMKISEDVLPRIPRKNQLHAVFRVGNGNEGGANKEMFFCKKNGKWWVITVKKVLPGNASKGFLKYQFMIQHPLFLHNK